MSTTITMQPAHRSGAHLPSVQASASKRAKLTAAQLAVLRAATQRADRLVALGDGLGLMTRRTLAGLLRRGLLVEVPAQAEQPVWRQDEQGHRLSAAITQAGLAALQECSLIAPKEPTEIERETGNDKAGDFSAPINSVDAQRQGPQPPEKGSKRELVLALLCRQEGASISEMMAVTGWLPHTTRAALTGLRHKGLVLERRSGADGKAVYRIIEPASDVLKPVPQVDQVA